MKLTTVSKSLLMILVLGGCNSISTMPDEVAFVGISDALFLGISKQDTEEISNNNLVKVCSEDLNSVPEKVAFMNRDGEILGENFSSIYVESIIRISPEYTVLYGDFTFTLSGGETRSSGLLVHNTTGALHDLEFQYIPSTYNCYLGSKYHQSDRNGNYYFHTEGIKRFIFNNPDQVLIEHYLDYPGNYRNYYIDGGGNIYFKQGELVKLASGGIIETGTKLLCFTGFDGTVYGFQTESSSALNLLSLKVEGEALIRELVLPSGIYFESLEGPNYYFPDSTHKQHLFLSGWLFHKTGDSFEHMPLGFVFNEDRGAIYPIQVPPGLSEEMTIFGMEDQYIWLRDHMNHEKFYALDLQSITLNEEANELEVAKYTEFELPAHLDIQDVRFSETKDIEFSAYDLSKERHVKGLLSMAGGLKYWDEDSSLGKILLTRIK